MAIPLEREFEAFKNAHMVLITRTALELQIKHEIDHSPVVNIPSFLLKNQINEEVTTVVNKAIFNNTFQSLYDKSWEYMKDKLPC